MEDLIGENIMDPNNVNENFQDEFDSPLEEKINQKDEGVVSDTGDSEDEELDEWREWAMSYEDENGDVID